MIRSFRGKALKAYVETGDRSKLSVQNTMRLDRILTALRDAATPEDMNLPGLRFHALSGRYTGRFAVNATANYRVTFGWDDRDAVDVDLEDYH